MPEQKRFEIYAECQYIESTGQIHRTGHYRWRFCVDDDIVCNSSRNFATRDFANGDIHDFMRAIDGADCGIHPDIIDVDLIPA